VSRLIFESQESIPKVTIDQNVHIEDIAGEWDIFLHTLSWAPKFCTDAGYSVKPLKHLTISRYFVEETCDVLPGIFLVITPEPRDRRRENATSLDVSDHSFQLQ